MKSSRSNGAHKQSGFTLLELLISLLITITVISGTVQMLVVSKSNFVTSRELAAAQENARYALKYIVDEIRMAGFTGCTSTPYYYANSIDSSTWYLKKPGLEGYEHEAGISNFPVAFRADTVANTDALIVRRTAPTGLTLKKIGSGNGNNAAHVPTSAHLNLNKAHAYKPGQPMLLTSPDCQWMGIFQMTGPANPNNNATHMEHNKGNAVSPGNCEKELAGKYDCADTSGKESEAYLEGSTLRELRSEAYYIGRSTTDNSVPALFRERMLVNSTTKALYTAEEELVKGVENMQIFYGLDNNLDDGIADIYKKASGISTPNEWSKVVSVRLSLRMRSLLPVYNQSENYGEFEGAAGTDGSDRFLRQDVSTTITLRNP